mmetsp:Transcript_68133/g.109747  ORF Transcript_68133/g.109747 Transcript_68133/m.109747 type:complete len:265 (-) Transcript_68133:785-1579(-)
MGQLSLAVPRQQSLVPGQAQGVEAHIAHVLAKHLVGQALRHRRPGQGQGVAVAGVVASLLRMPDRAAAALLLCIAAHEWVQVAAGELLHDGLACHAILSHHGCHGHHRQAAVVDLRKQLLLPLRALQLAHVSSKCWVAVVGRECLVLGLQGTSKGKDLEPSKSRHLVEGVDGRRNIREFQVHGWRQIAWEAAEEVRDEHADGGSHAHPAVLQLGLAVLLEGCLILEGHHPERIPVAQWGARTKLLRWVVLREVALTVVERRDVS